MGNIVGLSKRVLKNILWDLGFGWMICKRFREEGSCSKLDVVQKWGQLYACVSQ